MLEETLQLGVGGTGKSAACYRCPVGLLSLDPGPISQEQTDVRSLCLDGLPEVPEEPGSLSASYEPV